MVTVWRLYNIYLYTLYTKIDLSVTTVVIFIIPYCKLASRIYIITMNRLLHCVRTGCKPHSDNHLHHWMMITQNTNRVVVVSGNSGGFSHVVVVDKPAQFTLLLISLCMITLNTIRLGAVKPDSGISSFRTLLQQFSELASLLS